MKKIDFDSLLAPKSCACGREHRSDIKKIVMRCGALEELPEVVASFGADERVYMICDENTYEVAGKHVELLVSLSGKVVLDPRGLHANERSVDIVEQRLPEDATLLLAVGSGTVHDVTRYVAYCRKLRFVSVPTAASVDGFVSSVAAMTWHGVKRTLTALAPEAMVADIDVIAGAPTRLTASGVGDMLGKYVSLADWKISNILTGEYICPYIIGLVEEALLNVRKSMEKLSSGDKEAVTYLMYGLVLSGIAMQFSGNSRPASGSEHHISHFIEMTMPEEECGALHGEKVGVGLALVSRLYHGFAELSDEEITKRIHDYIRADDKYVADIFGGLAEEIYKENAKDCACGIRAEQITEKLDEIRAVLAQIPTEKEICDLLCVCGAPKTLEDIGLCEGRLIPLLYEAAPLVRNRLTLMRLLRCFDR